MLALAVIGLFVATSTATAAPTPYPAPPVVAVAVSAVDVVDGSPVDFTGTGFLARERINISVSYTTADGVVIAGESITTVADANGNFSISLPMTVNGVATLTAVGQTSGRTGTLTVNVHSADSAPGMGTTTVPPNDTAEPSTITTTLNGNAPATSTGPGNAGNGAGPGDTGAGNPGNAAGGGNPGEAGNAPGGGGSGVGSSGLASTGMNIAGPLTVGASALVVGLALLFFGTRLAIRRRSSSSRPQH